VKAASSTLSSFSGYYGFKVRLADPGQKGKVMIENCQEESSPPPDTDPSQQGSMPLALFWYWLGTIFLGVLLGMAAGLSQSPVIGILIPLLFSILSSAGGLYLSRADLEAPTFSRRTRIVGVFMVLFAVAVIFGSVYGITIRTGVGLRSFLPSWSDSPISLLPGNEDEFMDPALALELGALRLRLRSLGLTQSEENRTVQSAKFQLSESVPQFSLVTELRKVAVVARKTGDHATGALGDKSASEEEKRIAAEIWARTNAIAEDLDAFSGYIERGEGNLVNLYEKVRSGVEATRWIENVLGPQGDRGRPMHFLSETELRESSRELRLALLDLNFKVLQRRKQDWMSGTTLTDQIDSLINGLSGRIDPMPRPVPVFEVPP
jgi:hypothetical protein